MDDIDRKLEQIDKIVERLGPPEEEPKVVPLQAAPRPHPTARQGLTAASGSLTIMGVGVNTVAASSGHTHSIMPTHTTGQVAFNTADSQLYVCDNNGNWVTLNGVAGVQNITWQQP